MNRVHINASSEYDVCIGDGLLQSLGDLCADVLTGKGIAILSDSNVWPIYGRTVITSLKQAGFGPIAECVIPAGEASKSGATYLSVLNFLAENHITRSDCIIAVGGGVVGDLAGFAAATFLRGISFIQVPTTLLAAVDSSVGGKTAIDLPAGKNLAGAFYQPKLVVCDTACLSSLPKEVFLDGCAEVIKYAILFDPDLYAVLQKDGADFNRQAVIRRCVELKRDTVSADEFDRGLRQKLNLGHTLGHGIEANSNFTVSHGKAVAIGMVLASRIAAQLGLCDQELPAKIQALIYQFELPTETAVAPEELLQAALSDKKRTGGTINLVLPLTIGNCILRSTPVEELPVLIAQGVSP